MDFKKAVTAAALKATGKANQFREEGDEARDNKQWNTAALAYRHYLEQVPEDFGIWVQYGHALKESGNHTSAQKAYERALAIEPKNADLLLNFGHLKKLQGDLEAAAEYYRRSFEIDQNSAAEHEIFQLEGAIEDVVSGEVAGWVASAIRSKSFFAEINGVQQELSPRFYSRPELVAENRDGIGFSAIFISQQMDFELRIGYFLDAGVKRYLRFASTNSEMAHVQTSFHSRVALTANEFREIVAAIDPDTLQYQNILQKYAQTLAKADQRIDVLFIDGTPGRVSARYRIFNVAEGLQESGYTTLYARLDAASVAELTNLNCRVVVFARTPLDDNHKRLADAFRTRGAIIVFDIDDLVFDEKIIARIDGARSLDESEMKGYLWGVRHYRKFIEYADIVTTPTAYLSQYAEKCGARKVETIPNTIGRNYLRYYTDNRVTPKSRADGFVVGYYSGTKTHQADFRVASAGLIRFMRANPSARLRVVGFLDFEDFPEFQAIFDRIEIIEFMPFHKMIEDMCKCDVIIAPLETNNPFCDAKSELKFFEAGLVGRPCVASPTLTYQEASQQGKYCLLASSDDEWYETLSTLFLSDEKRQALAQNARGYVRSRYAYFTASKIAERIFFAIPSASITAQKVLSTRESSRGDGQSIGVIVPEIVIGGGGHRKIFKACYDLVGLGHSVTIYVMSKESAATISRKIKQFYYDFECEVRQFNGTLGKHKTIVCTNWSTAYVLRSYENKASVYYFVQDFEPLFQPASSEYAKAIATYSYGFNLVCYGGWVAEKIRREVGISPEIIPFSMDRTLYSDTPRMSKTVDVLFFARPSQPRRCYELGVEALRLVAEQQPTARIALYGEDAYGDLGFRYHNFGLIRQVSDLARIYRRSRVGICFSTTNPSLVGYEMLACGLPLIDLRVPGYEANFSGEDFVFYADPAPESICNVIAGCFADPLDYDRRVASGLKFAGSIPDDNVIGYSLDKLINGAAQQRRLSSTS